MSTPRTRRTIGALALTAAVGLALTGCIPAPPSLQSVSAPQPSAQSEAPGSSDPAEPSEPATPGSGGEAAAGDIAEGQIDADGTVAIALEVAERSAVVLAATSPEGEDLVLRLSGEGVDLREDDSLGDPDVFAFELEHRDPAIGTVLEPGAYTIEIEEYSGDPTGYRLHTLTGTTVVGPGESVEAAIAPAAPALVVVAAGSRVVGATSAVDTRLMVFEPEAINVEDDDGGEGLNPLLELDRPAGGDFAMLVWAYDRELSGTAQITVE